MQAEQCPPCSATRLNESPSEKEGKYRRPTRAGRDADGASMKVPPKRKGNARWRPGAGSHLDRASMKVPPKRKGNTGFFSIDLPPGQPQ